MSRVDPGDPKIKQAFDDVRNESTETNWLLATYEPKSSRLKLVGSGSGGWEEMIEDLSDGKIYYGFCRFTISGVFRYAYLSWCGEGVQGLLAGQYNNHALDMQRYFQGYHVHHYARNDGDLEESAVVAKLQKSIGAQYDAGQVIQGVQGNKGSSGPKAPVKTDPGVIDQAASSKYWESVRTEEASPASGYKKDLSFQAGVNAGGLKSRFETLAEQQRPDAPPPRGPPKQIKIETAPAPVHTPAPAAPAHEETYYDEGASYDQGATYDQGGYDEGSYDQGGYDQGDQGGYDQGGYDQGGYDQTGYEGSAEIYATALYDYPGEADGDLAFSAGDSILILDQSDPGGWWCGRLGDVEGYFPSNFVQLDQ